MSVLGLLEDVLELFLELVGGRGGHPKEKGSGDDTHHPDDMQDKLTKAAILGAAGYLGFRYGRTRVKDTWVASNENWVDGGGTNRAVPGTVEQAYR